MRKFKLFVLLLGIFSFLGLVSVKAAPEAAEVKVTYYLDGNVEVAETLVSGFNVGDQVILDSQTIVGDFMFWTVNDAGRRDLTETPNIKASKKLHLKAYYKSSVRVAAVFLDTNLKLLSGQFLAAADTLTIPADPVKPHATFAGWVPMENYDLGVPNKTPDKPTVDTYFVAKYSNPTKQYTVVIDGVSQGATLNQVVTATTALTNPVWKDEAGNVVGYGSPFKFTVLGNMNITSTAGEAVTSPQVLLRGPFDLRDGYVSYVGVLPSGVEVVEYGFEYVRLGVKHTVQSNVHNSETNEFLMSFLDNDKSQFRSYVKYVEAGVVNTVYSDYLTVAYVLTLDRTGLTSTQYASFEVLETAGKWSGSASKSNTGDRIGTRTNAGDQVSFTADASYYIEAVKVHVYSTSTSQRSIKVGEQTIASEITSTNPVNSGKVLLTGGEKTSITFVPVGGALQYESITVYVKPVPFNAARSDLEAISFESEYVTATNLTLPTTGTVNSSNIEWSSTHPGIISTTGTMVLPESTTEVTLTATATKDTDTYTKDYVITVVGIGTRLQAQLDDLEALPATTTEDLTLAPTTADGTTIAWTSSNTTYITDAGAVTRPTDADVDVTMTATVTEGSIVKTRPFVVKVLKQGATMVQHTVTIQRIGAKITTGIADGNINEYLTFTQNTGGTNQAQVVYDARGGTRTIFNNDANQIRIYKNGKITISVDSATIIKIEWTGTQNNGITINGTTQTTNQNGFLEFTGGVTEVVIEVYDVSKAQFRIDTITITYEIPS